MPLGLTRTCLLTLLLLSGCKSLPVPVEAPVAPPAQYMQDCSEPEQATPFTNGALAQYALDLRTTLRGCNADKAALREWSTMIGK